MWVTARARPRTDADSYFPRFPGIRKPNVYSAPTRTVSRSGNRRRSSIPPQTKSWITATRRYPSTSRREPRHVHPPFRWLAERAFDDRTKPAPLTDSGRSDVPGCAVPEGLRHAPVFPRFDVSGQFTRIHGPFPAPSVSSGRPANLLSQYFPVSYEIHRPILQLYSCNYKDKEIGQITDFGNSGLSTGSAG